ncbi:MAG: hypothetical protein OXC62_10810 [Aestuariivita sp.]|nr:hypothetical protein [Aestuariivita sp.]
MVDGIACLISEEVRYALYDLKRLGIASNDIALTAFPHVGVKNSFLNRLTEEKELETVLIDYLRECLITRQRR